MKKIVACILSFLCLVPSFCLPVYADDDEGIDYAAVFNTINSIRSSGPMDGDTMPWYPIADDDNTNTFKELKELFEGLDDSTLQFKAVTGTTAMFETYGQSFEDRITDGTRADFISKWSTFYSYITDKASGLANSKVFSYTLTASNILYFDSNQNPIKDTFIEIFNSNTAPYGYDSSQMDKNEAFKHSGNSENKQTISTIYAGTYVPNSVYYYADTYVYGINSQTNEIEDFSAMTGSFSGYTIVPFYYSQYYNTIYYFPDIMSASTPTNYSGRKKYNPIFHKINYGNDSSSQHGFTTSVYAFNKVDLNNIDSHLTIDSTYNMWYYNHSSSGGGSSDNAPYVINSLMDKPLTATKNKNTFLQYLSFGRWSNIYTADGAKQYFIYAPRVIEIILNGQWDSTARAPKGHYTYDFNRSRYTWLDDMSEGLSDPYYSAAAFKFEVSCDPEEALFDLYLDDELVDHDISYYTANLAYGRNFRVVLNVIDESKKLTGWNGITGTTNVVTGTTQSVPTIISPIIIGKTVYHVNALMNDDQSGTFEGIGDYFEGQTATLQFNPYPGYNFSHWSDGNIENPRHFEDIDSDQEVTAYTYIGGGSGAFGEAQDDLLVSAAIILLFLIIILK